MSELLPHIRTLAELCRARAKATPNRLSHVYLRDGETPQAQLTCERLDVAARAVAVEIGRHAPPGARALLHYPPGLDFVVAFFGCLYAGVIAVPIAPVEEGRGESAARARAVTRSASPSVVLCTAAFLESSANLCGTSTPAITIATDRVDPASAQDWHSHGDDADAIAYLQFSSGSTGDPKGAVLSHRQVLHNLDLITNLVRLTPDSNVVSWLPMFHDMGLLAGCILSVFTGCPVTLMSPAAFLMRPYRWLAALSSGDAISVAPTFALDLCVRRIGERQRAGLDLSGLRQVIIGAEPVRAQTLERFTEAFAPCGLRPQALQPCYGLAEATLLVTGGPPSRPPTIRTFDATPSESGRRSRPLVACGEVAGDLRVVIADPETLVPCAVDQVGEILVSGASVASGYWNAPEATAKTFGVTVPGHEGRYLRTGDLGVLLDGQLFITGRHKDTIVVDGANHYPTDLESTVEIADPAVRPGRCAVVSVEDSRRERVVVLAETSAPAADATRIAGAVRRAVSEQHGIAVHDVVVLPPGRLPFTSSGKLRRAACRAGYQEGSLRSTRPVTVPS